MPIKRFIQRWQP